MTKRPVTITYSENVNAECLERIAAIALRYAEPGVGVLLIPQAVTRQPVDASIDVHEPGFKERHFAWKPLVPGTNTEGQFRYLEEGKYDAHPTEVNGAKPLTQGLCRAPHPEDPAYECNRPPNHNSYHLSPIAPTGKRAWETRP